MGEHTRRSKTSNCWSSGHIRIHACHITDQCSLFPQSFQPFRPSQTVSEKYTLRYDIQPALATTTPEQFENQPGIITNSHPFVLFSLFLLLFLTCMAEPQSIFVHLKVNKRFPFPLSFYTSISRMQSSLAVSQVAHGSSKEGP